MLKYKIPQIVTLTPLFLFLSLSTHLVRLIERESLDNQSTIKAY